MQYLQNIGTKKRLVNTFAIILLLVANVVVGNAQVQVIQVATKTIEKHFTYQEGYEVNIEGEKAEINFESWDKDEIFIRVELVAKHSDEEVAKQDLETLELVAKRVKNKIYIRNYLSLKNKSVKTESILAVRYHIQLPEHCPVYVKNYFGAVSINNLSNRLRLNGKYSKIGLNNIEGFIDVSTRFGDLLAHNLVGETTINAHRSDVVLKEVKGSLDINAQYGKIEIFTQDQLLDLNIQAENSNVALITPQPGSLSYKLSAKNGDISLPDNLDVKHLNKTDFIKKVEVYPNRDVLLPNININVTHGNITVVKRL